MLVPLCQPMNGVWRLPPGGVLLPELFVVWMLNLVVVAPKGIVKKLGCVTASPTAGRPCSVLAVV